MFFLVDLNPEVMIAKLLHAPSAQEINLMEYFHTCVGVNNGPP